MYNVPEYMYWQAPLNKDAWGVYKFNQETGLYEALVEYNGDGQRCKQATPWSPSYVLRLAAGFKQITKEEAFMRML